MWRIICVCGRIKVEFLLPWLGALALVSSVGTQDGEEWAAPRIELRALSGTAGRSQGINLALLCLGSLVKNPWSQGTKKRVRWRDQSPHREK